MLKHRPSSRKQFRLSRLPAQKHLASRPFQSRQDVTVCVATMANDGSIFGAADRMLTRGITLTEPRLTKIYHYEGQLPVSVMWSGSAPIFAEVIHGWGHAVNASPQKYTSIQAYVDLYSDQFSNYIGKRAERAILTRLGLTRKDIVSGKVSYDHAKRLGQQLIDYCLMADEDVEVIIAGHDPDGAHIWTVLNSSPYCRDVEGFAAVGIGAGHAYSQLDFAGYSRQATPPEALIMAYMAKRRGETAPGVGKATDMFSRQLPKDQKPPQWWPVPEEWLGKFNAEYEKFAQAEKDALASAVRSTVGAMFAIAAASKVATPQTPLADVNPAPEPQSPPESTHGQ